MSNPPELVAEVSPPTTGRIFCSPVVWLNLLCLDAPIVAVSWQWLFAHTFGAQLDLSLRALHRAGAANEFVPRLRLATLDGRHVA